MMHQTPHSSMARTSRSASRRLTVQPKAILGLFGGAKAASATREQRKEQLLDLIRPLKRGVVATEEDKAAVEAAAKALESVNPTPKALASPLVNGKWELLYTTSSSILGTNKPALLRPTGPIYQVIDAVALKARNIEGAPFFNQVSADLQPLSANKVAVQFREFRLLNLIAIKAPESAKGELAVTYLDEELRVSRGDKGNLFVLRMADREAKP